MTYVAARCPAAGRSAFRCGFGSGAGAATTPDTDSSSANNASRFTAISSGGGVGQVNTRGMSGQGPSLVARYVGSGKRFERASRTHHGRQPLDLLKTGER